MLRIFFSFFLLFAIATTTSAQKAKTLSNDDFTPSTNKPAPSEPVRKVETAQALPPLPPTVEVNCHINERVDLRNNEVMIIKPQTTSDFAKIKTKSNPFVLSIEFEGKPTSPDPSIKLFPTLSILYGHEDFATIKIGNESFPVIAFEQYNDFYNSKKNATPSLLTAGSQGQSSRTMDYHDFMLLLFDIPTSKLNEKKDLKLFFYINRTKFTVITQIP